MLLLPITRRNFAKKGGIPYHLAVAFENHKYVCHATNDPVHHAEANVLKKLNYLETKHDIKWNKLKIIVVRMKLEENTIKFVLSKPCVNCCKLLKCSRVKNISWSTSSGSFKTCRVCDFESTQVSRKFRDSFHL